MLFLALKCLCTVHKTEQLLTRKLLSHLLCHGTPILEKTRCIFLMLVTKILPDLYSSFDGPGEERLKWREVDNNF